MAYLAPCLARLRSEVNATWPNRDRTSDGWIGDASHQARPSDHNPDPPVIGVVRAIDIDIDGISELDVVAAAFRHPATNYVIYNRRIAQRANGFAWRTYTGSNPHDKHVHISIRKGYEAAAEGWLGSSTSVVSNPGGGSGGSVTSGPSVTAPDPITPRGPFDMLTDKQQQEILDGVRALQGVPPAVQGLGGVPEGVQSLLDQTAVVIRPTLQTLLDRTLRLEPIAAAVQAILDRPGDATPETFAGISDDDLQRIAKAVNDETHRRSAA